MLPGAMPEQYTKTSEARAFAIILIAKALASLYQTCDSVE